MHKLRVGVLMGGKSIEKEVSFNSGRTICDHLDTEQYDIIPIFQTNTKLFLLPWHFLHRGKTTDFEHRLESEAQPIAWDDLKETVDFMYIATHGRFAEDGTLQGFLQVLGIPYLGSGILASALRMDKILQKTFLQNAGITVPQYTTLNPYEIATIKNTDSIVEKISAHNIKPPYVVKPYNEGSSLGISVILDKKNLIRAIKTACHIDARKPKTVIIEEKIDGMEFSCITLTDYKTGEFLPLPPTEIILEENTHLFDYEQKYMPGRATKFTPARINNALIKKIQDTCVHIMKVLGFTTLSRIDGFLTPDEQIIIIDPNTLSGMAPSSFFFHQAAEINMSHTQLINHLIETELYNYGMLEKIKKQEKKEQSMITKKTRVAVLLGGRSNEKEISLESGRNIVYKLSPKKYDAIPIFVNKNLELFILTQSQLVCNSTKEIESLLDQKQKIKWDNLSTITDFVFNALHGGEGENGAVQGTLEILDLPYNGSSVLASALCMDKYKTAQFLKAQGFDVPKQVFVAKHQWKQQQNYIIKTVEQVIVYPCIIKPHDGGCSVMVQIAKNSTELVSIVNMLCFNNKQSVLIEKYITGMELTVGIIGNNNPRALPPSQAITQGGILSVEEKFLPGNGENQTPALLPQKTLSFIQKTIKQAYTALQCKGYARIDCFYQTAKESPTGKQRIIVLEVNTLPGLTPATCIFHQAAEIGLKPMDFIDQIVQIGFEEHGERLDNTIKSTDKKIESGKDLNVTL